LSPQEVSLLTISRGAPASVPDVVAMLRAIDALLPDSDGLKWFNWLYLQVTESVNANVGHTGQGGRGGLVDAAWLAELDVRFASLYFSALERWLASEGHPSPHCWAAMFNRREDVMLARIQFALAGINAHISHDLALAIVATCEATSVAPSHQSQQYRDFKALNANLDALIETAKKTLRVRLLGQVLPAVSRLEDTIGGWNIAASREAAWVSAEALWLIRHEPFLRSEYEKRLDDLTTAANEALLITIP
jgi:hypothetical protein